MKLALVILGIVVAAGAAIISGDRTVIMLAGGIILVGVGILVP